MSGFEGIFDADALRATAPLLALAVGLALMLVADVIGATRAVRGSLLLLALAGAAAMEWALWAGDRELLVLHASFRADRSTALWGLLFLASTALAWVFSVGYYRREDRPFKGEHDVLMLAAPIGMMLMVGARELLVFFVGLELLSIPLYVLAGFSRGRARSVEAGLKYFLLGSFASGFFLYGAALLYAGTGHLSLEALAADGEALQSPLALAGLALMTASLFFKASVFPFHLWVPDVYQGSPTPVTVLMATGTKAAAFAFLINLAFLLPPDSAAMVATIALITMALANLGALVQDDLKRLLAYSGVAHAGTLLLVIAGELAAPGHGALPAALIYMAAYVFTAGGAFGVVSLLESDGERYTRLENLRGLARSRPRTAAALALFMLSLGGIPATGGFIGKWLVFSVLVEAHMYTAAVIGALLSVVALGYYLRVIVVMYMQPAPEGEVAPSTTRPLTAGLATAVCSAVVLALGLLPGWFLGLL